MRSDFFKVQLQINESFFVSVKTKEVVKATYNHFDILKRHPCEDDVGWTSRHQGTNVERAFVSMDTFEQLLSEQSEPRTQEISETEFLEEKQKTESRTIEVINESYNSSADDEMGDIIAEEYRASNSSEEPYY